jgi:hypothetical protein
LSSLHRGAIIRSTTDGADRSVGAGGSLRIDAPGQGSLYVVEQAIAACAVDYVGYLVAVLDEQVLTMRSEH